MPGFSIHVSICKSERHKLGEQGQNVVFLLNFIGITDVIGKLYIPQN